jgi:hypothetical protein
MISRDEEIFMKMLVSFLFITLGLTQFALAQRVGLTLGLSQVQIEGASGADISSSGSYQFGALFYQPMTELVEVRLGALLAQQSLVFSKGGNDTTIGIANLNVPVTAGFRIGERFLLFAGPVLSINAQKSCSNSNGQTCSTSDLKIKGTDILLSLGANFQLTSELGLELSFDRMGGKPFEGSTGGQMINVNFQYVIE